LRRHNPDTAIAMVNLLGNVVVFVPVGALAVLGLRARWWQAILIGGALSTGIEIALHYVGRASDIDDIILNTSGAAVGAIAAAVLLHVAARLRSARAISV